LYFKNIFERIKFFYFFELIFLKKNQIATEITVTSGGLHSFLRVENVGEPNQDLWLSWSTSNPSGSNGFQKIKNLWALFSLSLSLYLTEDSHKKERNQ
jgi:hypothetical protein